MFVIHRRREHGPRKINGTTLSIWCRRTQIREIASDKYYRYRRYPNTAPALHETTAGRRQRNCGVHLLNSEKHSCCVRIGSRGGGSGCWNRLLGTAGVSLCEDWLAHRPPGWRGTVIGVGGTVIVRGFAHTLSEYTPASLPSAVLRYPFHTMRIDAWSLGCGGGSVRDHRPVGV